LQIAHVGEQRRRTARVQEDDILCAFEMSFPNQVDESGQRLAAVHRIEQQPFQASEQHHGVVHRLRRDSVAIADVVAIRDDVPAGNDARYLGNVLHRAFETIVKEGLDQWDERRVNQTKPSLEAALLAEGMSHLNLDKTVEKGLRALKNILKDEKGRKVLNRYEGEEVEFALTYIEDRNFRTKIIDRTYVDDEDIRWIIDYKTGEHKGGSIEVFFEEEKDRYRPQLESYEQLIRLQGETRKIKKALYYPLHQRLVEIQ